MRRGHAVRTVVLGLAFLAVAGFGLAAFGRKISSREPFLGVDWIPSRQGIVALTVVPAGPAAEAGLLPGDRLLRVNGSEVRGVVSAGELPWDLPRGRAARFDVDRGGVTLDLRITPVARRTVPPLYGFLSLVGAAFFASGAFVALRWPLVRGSAVYGALGAALFANLVFSQTGRADSFDWLVHAADVAAGMLSPALLIHLAIALSRRSVPSRRMWIVAGYVPVAILALAAVWVEALGGAYRFHDPVRAVSAIERVQLGYLVLAVLVAVFILWRSYARSSSTLHRGQMRWMLWGLGIGLGPFVAVYVVPWVLGDNVPEWAELFALPMLFVPAAFTAAMTRYRLHDLDLVLRRGLAGVTLAFVTVGVYAASLVVLRQLAGETALPSDVLNLLAAVLAAVMYPKLRGWVTIGVDRAFYRARYSYRATLLEWGRELNAEVNLPALLQRLEQRVRDTLAVPQARVLVRVGSRRFETVEPAVPGSAVELDRAILDALERQSAIALDERGLAGLPWARHLFGMKVKGRIKAFLATSERQGAEQPLSSEDRALLATLCSQTATAIEAARLVREVRQHADEVEMLKARQERILESSGVGLLLVDASGSIQAWNRALEAIYGLDKDDALGRGLSDVFPLHTVRALERREAETPPGEEVRLYGHTLVNRRGQRVVANIAVSPVAGGLAVPDGGRVITVDDVTERVKLEEQVVRQERLASLGLLAAGVAHEVNTPLTGISSYTQMLLEEMAEDDPRRPVLEKIESQSRRASDIANSLLNLARPERAAFEALSLNDTVREVVKLFEPQIRGRGLKLSMHLDPGLQPVLGHKGKLQQVVLNLLLNARDAVGPGGTVAVSTAVRNGRVALEVWDDGCGIAEEDLSRVFDPFFTTKGRGKGTGLGLSISYGIVREHEGEMQVESVPGEFTRFRVDLPPHETGRAVAEPAAR